MTGLVILVAVVAVVGGGLLVVGIAVAGGSRAGRVNPMGPGPPGGHAGPPADPWAYQASPYQASHYQAGPAMLSEQATARVRALMSQGQKIQAIKLVRE